MNLKKVHHIAIIGSDYEKSKHFYVDLLGFSIIRENYRPERDDYKIDLQLDEIELELFIIKKLSEASKLSGGLWSQASCLCCRLGR